MTNKLEAIKQEVIARLLLAGVAIADVYPDAVQSMGNYFPLAILESESCEGINTANNLTRYEYVLNVYIVTQVGYNKQKTHEDLVFACLNAVYIDNNLAGKCLLTIPMNISFKAALPGLLDSVNQDDFQKSVITFNFLTEDTRNG